VRLSEELPNPAHYVFGTDWNFSVGKNLVLTPSYYYGTFRTPSGLTGHRHVPIIAAKPIFSRGKWTVSDRNRFGWRIDSLAAATTWFYRNRPEVDYQTSPSLWVSYLFAWDEVFYFSNRGWSRNRVAAGAQKKFNDRFAVDLYYQREDSKAAGTEPPHVNTVAIVIYVRIR
jgi:hypothetical protein